ncbi:hypothetical protein [Conexibacter sp. SYSU D00693]|uniref:hypothetical protein n=1 Tax=Conexibacter sp. SYSU D00693 TaxID=2812560 RepID=UPI00196B90B8|nr:hypothetical protein [Conexibacter sp. SYSU D00693]
MRRRLALPAMALAAALAAPAGAHAAFFQAEPVDGPTPDIVSVGDVDVARDGSGAITYVKKDGGVDHVFVSRLVNGSFQAPERLDGGIEAPAQTPAVAVTDGGRAAVVWESGGGLWAAVKPAGDQPWTAPQVVAAGGSAPSVDMSINGGAYVSFTVGTDVRLARLGRKDAGFVGLPDAADVDAAHPAGDGTRRSRLAIAADGTAVVVFGEQLGDGRTHTIARRVFQDRVSTSPVDATLDSLDGRAGGDADLPEVDVEDDSSFAYVAFRQSLGGQTRSIVRRLRGGAFDEPLVGDAVEPGGPDAIASTRVDVSGRGEGIITSASGSGVFGALLRENKLVPARVLGGGGPYSRPAGGVAESQDRVAAWIDGDLVRASYWDDKPESRIAPLPSEPTTISNPGLGPVDQSGGFDAGIDRIGNAVAAFVQGQGGDRRLVAAVYDRTPGTFLGLTTTKWRAYARPPLSWQAPLDLWGPITYSVQIGGKEVAKTTDTKVTVPTVVPDGILTWKVVATDKRGQTSTMKPRNLRVDHTPPSLTVKVRKRGRVVSVTAKAKDVVKGSTRASGFKLVRIAWGDGAKTDALRASHRYSRKGKVTITISAYDNAGARKDVKKSVKL